MTLLVLSGRYSDDSQLLWRSAIEIGWDIHRALRYDVPILSSNPKCCYGEVLFCDIMAQKLGLGLLEPLDGWLAMHVPEAFLKRHVGFRFAKDLGSIQEPRFIKPANDKLFKAGIYESGSAVPEVHPFCAVLVSEIVDFEYEVRCWVLDRKVMTAALYRFVDDPSEPDGVPTQHFVDEATGWLQGMLDVLGDDRALYLPSAVVVDVGFIRGKGWAVVEANPCWASGVYEGADPMKILPLILRAAGPRSQVGWQDECYLRNPHG